MEQYVIIFKEQVNLIDLQILNQGVIEILFNTYKLSLLRSCDRESRWPFESGIEFSKMTLISYLVGSLTSNKVCQEALVFIFLCKMFGAKLFRETE